jgi:hypothetical protein
MKSLIFTNHSLDTFSGGNIASISFINSISTFSTKCFLVYPEKNKVLNFIDKKIIKFGVKNDNNIFKKIINIYLGRINRFHNIYFTIIKQIDPDIIFFDNSRASSSFFNLYKDFKKIKIVTIHHNYEMEYYKDSPVNIFIRFPFMYYMKKAEKEAILNSNLNLVLTDYDLNKLKNKYDIENTSIFYKIGIFESTISQFNNNSFKPNYILNKNLNKITFIITGNLCAPQTLNSLLPFFNLEFKIIKEIFPFSNLIIAGRNPSLSLIKICKKNNIELIINPTNMDDIIKRADIYICPINLGGGIKLRILDGLKNGLPILSHKIASRGYESFISNNFMFTYTTIYNFKIQLLKFKNIYNYSDNDLNNKIINLYRQEYSFDNGTNRLNNIVMKLF